MKKLHLALIDFISGVIAFSALYAMDARPAFYVILLLFGVVQRFCAYHHGKADANRATIRRFV